MTISLMRMKVMRGVNRQFSLLLFIFVSVVGGRYAIAEGVESDVSFSAISISQITDGALSSMNGIVSINQASGDDNAQSNSRAVALSQSGGVAIAYTYTGQRSLVNLQQAPGVAVTRIAGTSFANSHGLLAVNQSAGVGNLQLNSFVLSGSIDGELTDSMLSETLTGMSAMPESDGSRSNTQRTVTVDKSAFIGTSGVVQLSQVAGSGNMTRNRFEMSFNPQH